MCYVDDVEGEFYTERWRKARTEHVCGECGRMIAKSEHYISAAGKYGGYFSSYKVCAHCYAAAKWLVKVCGGWVFDALGEELREHWDDYPEYRSFWLGRAIVGIRRGWHRRDGALLQIPVAPTLPKVLAPPTVSA